MNQTCVKSNQIGEGIIKGNLLPVSGHSWVSSDTSDIGRYKNRDGYGLSGFYFRDFKNMRHAISLDNGHFQTKYRFPIVDIPFSSPMHRWDNLYFCGGYGATLPDGQQFDTNERLIEYVLKKQKPMGFIVVEKSKIDRFIQMVEGNLDYKIMPHFREDYVELGFANIGKIGDLFDIEQLICSYQILNEKMGFELNESNATKLRKITDCEFKDFFDYDYANPNYMIDCMIVGLILGFPVESTFAFLNNYR
ncbi:hypothetical protein ACUIJN_12760 [Metabacillus halosaccharovorans]|uniref:hypothetical protein n=1 Tax=Metabacillus halosaccharovorans TaxID=930124 RepID=UPI00403D591C